MPYGYGDMVNPNAHVHALVSEGAWRPDGVFEPLPLGTDMHLLTELFRHHVFRALRKARRINEVTIQRMLTWTHSGFNCHRGNELEAGDSDGRRRVARYLLHPPLSLERMTYDREAGVVTYRSDRQHRLENFDPLDWLARVASHIPEKGTQLVRYFGTYSNRFRGAARKAQACEQPPAPGDAPERRAPLAVRKSWARLLAAVWATDPLLCPRCGGAMRIIAAINDPVTVKKILRHLGLWTVPTRASPRRFEADDDFDDGTEQPSAEQASEQASFEDVPPQPSSAQTWPDQTWPDTSDVSQSASPQEAHDPWLDAWPDADPSWDD